MSQIIVKPRLPGKSIWPLLAYAQQNGWSVERSRGGHLCFRKTGKQSMFTSSTPSDQRAVRNALARLIRFDRMEASHA